MVVVGVVEVVMSIPSPLSREGRGTKSRQARRRCGARLPVHFTKSYRYRALVCDAPNPSIPGVYVSSMRDMIDGE